MATKPELNIAEYGKDISSVQYNDNFNKLNDYIEAISEELMLKVNTINSQLNSNVLSNLQSIYPVGSLYIGTTDTCPITNLFGTWEKIEEGLCLQSVKGDQVAGTTVEAGLPDHNHSYTAGSFWGADPGGARAAWSAGDSYYDTTTGTFTNASKSNPIYGNSDTVQPPAYLVNIWKRTA